jgi:hypothetical protein
MLHLMPTLIYQSIFDPRNVMFLSRDLSKALIGRHSKHCVSARQLFDLKKTNGETHIVSSSQMWTQKIFRHLVSHVPLSLTLETI